LPRPPGRWIDFLMTDASAQGDPQQMVAYHRALDGSSVGATGIGGRGTLRQLEFLVAPNTVLRVRSFRVQGVHSGGVASGGLVGAFVVLGAVLVCIMALGWCRQRGRSTPP